MFTRHHQRTAVICQPVNLTETLGSCLVYRVLQPQEDKEEEEEEEMESVLYVEELKTKIIRIR